MTKTVKTRKKLIEVALPLEAINKASAREKSIRHGHPSTLHLWWARRPLAAARAVIFAQMVDDPSSLPDLFPTEKKQEKERERLFQIIEDLVQWENTTNETVLQQARDEIWQSWRYTCAENADHPRAKELFDRYKLPAFHDPFAGGGALPLEAQRLGLESYASDLNPVAVLINKAMIEIPPRFVGRPPVHPDGSGDGELGNVQFVGRVSGDSRVTRHPAAESSGFASLTRPTGSGELFAREWKGAQGLAEDVRHYGKWMRDEAERRIGQLYPPIEVTAEMAKDRPDLKPYVGQELTVIAWLWARTVKSPNPAFANVEVPLASTFMLSTKAGKEAYVEPVIEGGSYRFTVKVGKPKDAEKAKGGTKLSRGANFACLMSDTPIASEHIYGEANAGRMGARLMAIVAEGTRGRVYLAPTPEHEAAARKAKPEWKPEVAMPANPRWFSPPLYGLTTYGDLFTPRQLVALTTFSDLVGEAMQQVRRDALLGARASGPPSASPAGWHSRGYHPHFDQPGLIQSITFRLHDSVPSELLEKWRAELKVTEASAAADSRCVELRERIARYEDAGHGACYLGDARVAQLVENALLHFDGERYRLLKWCVMPNHVHVLIETLEGHPLSDVVRSWKTFTAREANRLLGREGAFWMADYHDRFVRDEAHLSAVSAYIRENPVKAGLCGRAEEWRYGSAWEGERAGGPRTQDLPLRDGGTGATAYAEAVGVYLGFGSSRASDAWSSVVTWRNQVDSPRNTFARQALPMTWDYTEVNPFSDSAGNWTGNSIQWVREGLEHLPQGSSRGHGSQQDAAAQSVSADKLVSTDPPYYDNIGYADLSDFFYVWLRRSLRGVFPDLFATLAVPKSEELVATPYRHGSKEKAETFFLDGMTQAMHRLVEQAHQAFPVTIYYAFKQSEALGARASGPHNEEADQRSAHPGTHPGTVSTGWETFLDAVIRAGFGISGTWPMRTEKQGRVIANDTNALASSIVLVCRQRAATAPTATRREFVAALKAELPAALRHLQEGNIAPVDLAQAAIGPGMAVYTRYAKVLDAEGKPVAVREALALINQVLDETLAEQEGDFDADSRFAIAWFEQHGFVEGEFGVADVLARAKNTSVDGLRDAGLLESKRGKVRLLKAAELPADWDPALDARFTHWEAVHHLIRALEAGGERAAAVLVARLGSRAETARELAYRLYTVCERKKRANEAMAYNALVQSWPEITRLARETPRVATPGTADLFDLE